MRTERARGCKRRGLEAGGAVSLRAEMASSSRDWSGARAVIWARQGALGASHRLPPDNWMGIPLR